ncbi:MAG: prepilin-type N-terminal cleavage/methylation domain-containing protein, partial [bacterium]|nr:prepilin-type N-terminal cleavage/methylation domain-containing protein [bacterium]
MEGEHGFTLIELVVAVAIAVLLLAAGGAWMLGMHPGALRAAVNDVDADLDAARAIASSSGNGATLAFLPRAGRPGFEVRVYSGRPTRAGTVTPSTVMFVESDASVREATFGAPPFAIFLSSAGTPSGMGAYPQVAGGVVSFPAVAAQPPCPASGAIVLTFANAQGARDTRTLRCDGVVVGSAVANPPPSPNPLRLSPAIAVAHWTRDAYPLQFAAAEYGYAQWIASATGTGCATRGSDTGGAPAIFPSPWPYRTPGPSASANPPPPNAPYTYPDLAVPDDPPARFALQPVAGNGGICEVRVSDAFGQTASSQVQVMGDLTPAPRTLTFASPHAAAQRLLLAKTWDNEPLALAYGGDCANIVATTTLAASTPSVASATPATVTLDVAPRAAGTCAMQFTDQYREPWASIAVTVKSPPRFATWPQQLSVGANGAAVAQTTSAATYTGACYAQARTLAGGVDTSLPLLTAQALGVQVASDGCILNADASGPYGTSTGGGTTGTPTGVMIAYEPVGSGQ